jgi:uncharacterized membrane protein
LPLRPRAPARGTLRLVAAGLIAAAIVHIIATLAAPYVNTATAWARLKTRVPANQMVLLPPITPGSQQLPFQLPDFRYAVCRYDTSQGPLQVRVHLANPGWVLTVTSAQGDSIYSVQAQERARKDVNLLLVPPGERFVGLVGETAGLSALNLALPAPHGLVVVHAPNSGAAFRTANEADLRRSLCLPQPL